MPGSEFSFHPWLASALRQKFEMPDSILRVREESCVDLSCPINETWVEIFPTSLSESVMTIRFSRKKEFISKIDFRLSVDRQKMS
ncbi:hypothetical protein CH373_07040 [Leptospira perolatii]|uniref:Uncharacterized protein n=2 Tax=Leptospira perolatii TaxID=2023191 RepID=A0A2M9ZQ06_9LEPT|nr:hypothetical protein CH360_03900 [Leptospira perolatii]PJZ74051.1 hypothetical protein CH373_07040 [Leptospira perolatii]